MNRRRKSAASGEWRFLVALVMLAAPGVAFLYAVISGATWFAWPIWYEAGFVAAGVWRELVRDDI